MAASGFFIAGTDTGVGKTVVTTALMRCAREQGWQVSGMKPVASGAEMTAEGLRNEDALAIQAQCSQPTQYAQINPCVFAAPASPNIAAELAGEAVNLDLIQQAWQHIPADNLAFVEGVGGWQVPLDRRHTTADLAVQLGLPVILVIGLRLGCINHGLLSATAIEASGLRLAGWIMSEIDPETEYKSKIINTLQDSIDAPLLGVIPFQENISSAGAAVALDIPSFQALL